MASLWDRFPEILQETPPQIKYWVRSKSDLHIITESSRLNVENQPVWWG